MSYVEPPSVQPAPWETMPAPIPAPQLPALPVAKDVGWDAMDREDQAIATAEFLKKRKRSARRLGVRRAAVILWLLIALILFIVGVVALFYSPGVAAVYWPIALLCVYIAARAANGGRRLTPQSTNVRPRKRYRVVPFIFFRL